LQRQYDAGHAVAAFSSGLTLGSHIPVERGAWSAALGSDAPLEAGKDAALNKIVTATDELLAAAWRASLKADLPTLPRS